MRQGCLMSPTIFLLVVDWILKISTENANTRICWSFTKQLEDLNFAQYQPTVTQATIRTAGAQPALGGSRENWPQNKHQENRNHEDEKTNNRTKSNYMVWTSAMLTSSSTWAVWSARTEEQMRTSAAASTKPYMLSTPYAPSGTQQYSSSRPRSASSVPT